MSIANVHSVSSSHGSRAIEASGLTAEAAVPGDFGNTLAALKKPVEDPKAQTRLPAQAEPLESPAMTGNALENTDGQKDLVDFLQKYLPLASTTGKQAERTDPEAPVTNLAAGQQGISNGTPTKPPVQNDTMPQATEGALPTQDINLLLDTSPALEKTISLAPTVERETGQAAPEAPAVDLTTAQPSPALAMLAQIPVQDTKVTQYMDAAADIALTQDTPTSKNPSEQVQLPVSGEKTAQDGSPQKETFLSLLNKDTAGSDPQSGSTDAVEPAEKPLASLANVTGQEKLTPNAAATETFSIPKTAEQKIELPAITKPLNHPGWGKDLGEHIVWMNSKDISAAEIKLNPLHLGPISVRIDVGQDNQATIQFTAQHVETKEALEASIPKLRDMLNSQNVNLVNVNISQNPGSNQGRQAGQPFHGASGNQTPPIDAGANVLEMGELEHIVSKGLLSLYA